MGWCNGEGTRQLMNFAIFDIETRIDKALIRAVMFPHDDVTEEEAYQRFRQQVSEERDHRNDFLPIAFDIPISIVVGNVTGNHTLTAVEVLCAQDYSEEGIVCEFWRRVEIFPGTLVSFNGRAFDLPVMEMQALRYGCQAPRYFNEKYGHRYRYSEERHYDLFDFLSNVGVHRIRGGFNLLARLIGLPGKTWVDGSMIQGLWEAGQLGLIHTLLPPRRHPNLRSVPAYRAHAWTSHFRGISGGLGRGHALSRRALRDAWDNTAGAEWRGPNSHAGRDKQGYIAGTRVMTRAGHRTRFEASTSV